MCFPISVVFASYSCHEESIKRLPNQTETKIYLKGLVSAFSPGLTPRRLNRFHILSLKMKLNLFFLQHSVKYTTLAALQWHLSVTLGRLSNTDVKWSHDSGWSLPEKPTFFFSLQFQPQTTCDCRLLFCLANTSWPCNKICSQTVVSKATNL